MQHGWKKVGKETAKRTLQAFCEMSVELAILWFPRR